MTGTFTEGTGFGDGVAVGTGEGFADGLGDGFGEGADDGFGEGAGVGDDVGPGALESTVESDCCPCVVRAVTPDCGRHPEKTATTIETPVSRKTFPMNLTPIPEFRANAGTPK
jgi:hypothetical protein